MKVKEFQNIIEETKIEVKDYGTYYGVSFTLDDGGITIPVYGEMLRTGDILFFPELDKGPGELTKQEWIDIAVKAMGREG